MSKNRKTTIYIAGGAVVLYLLYRWYSARSQQASTTSAGIGTDPTASAQYAGLAGQEQSDMAALQSQNTQLAAQEQSDVQNLQSGIAGLTTDIQGISVPTQDEINAWIQAAIGAQAPPQSVPSVGTGSTPTTSTTGGPSIITKISAVPKQIYDTIFNQGYQEHWNATHGKPQGYHLTRAKSYQSYGISQGVWNQIFNTGYKSVK